MENLDKIGQLIYNLEIGYKLYKLDDNYLKYEKEVIRCKNAHYSYWFALKVKGANIKQHENVIVNSLDGKYIFQFAQDISGADIKRLQEAVLKSGDSKSIYKFARYIKNCDIKKLQEVILKSGDASSLYLFARDIKGADIKRLQEALLKYGNAEYMCYFLRDVEGADIELLHDAILKSDDAWSNWSVSKKNVNGNGKVLKHYDAVINSGNLKYIADILDSAELYYKNLDEKKIIKIMTAIKNSVLFSEGCSNCYDLFLLKKIGLLFNDKIVTDMACLNACEDILIDGLKNDNISYINYIIYWICNVDMANVGKLQEAVLKSGNARFNYEFAKAIDCGQVKLDSKEFEKHRMFVLESGDPDSNWMFAYYLQNKLLACQDIDGKLEKYFGSIDYDLVKLINKIISSGDIAIREVNKYFLEIKLDEKIKEHRDVVVKSGDGLCNSKFARYIYGTDIKLHEKVVLESKNAEASYCFYGIPGADKEKHEAIILASDDENYRNLFEVSHSKKKVLKI